MSIFLPESWNARKGSDYSDLCLGLLLGLGSLKFGTPANLAEMTSAPGNIYEFLLVSWPLNWGYVLAVLVCAGLIVAGRGRVCANYLIYCGVGWILWNVIASFGTMDAVLTGQVMVHFWVVLLIWYTGWVIARRGVRYSWLFAGIALGVIWVIWNGCQQKFGGLEETRKFIYSQEGWQNLPAEFLYRIERDRIFATLTYPNALAAFLVLSVPCLMVWLHRVGESMHGKRLGWVLSILAGISGLMCLFWTGSKTGYLVAAVQIALGTILWLPVSRKWKAGLVIGMLLLGGILFGWKYNDYFRDGARSLTVGRFGYWRAAVENVQSHPWTGSGPGTFMRVFQKIKRPEDEMARLVHNDYLQQATDSGLPAALFYIVLVFGTLWSARGFLIRPQGTTDPGKFSSYLCASWIGAAGWSLQSFMEWTLYVPAISWLAFLLLGLLAGSLKSEKYKTKSQLP